MNKQIASETQKQLLSGILQTLLISLVFLGFFSLIAVGKVHAEPPRCASESANGDRVLDGECNGYYTGSAVDGTVTPYTFSDDKCYTISRPETGPNDFDIREIPCDSYEGELRQASVASTKQLNTDCKTLDDCKIIGYLRDFINVLSAVVGIVVVIMIAFGGIKYSASRDNPQATAAAKQHITNALLALVLYIFLFAILEYLVPGGVF